MDFKFSQDSKGPAPAASSDKIRQKTLLAVLLILVAAFAYLYYFTGLIKPQEARVPAEAPAPQAMRKPLPARSGEPANAGTAGAPEPHQTDAATAGTDPRKVASAGTQQEPRSSEPAKGSSPADAENKPAATGQQPAAAEKKPAIPEKKGGAPGAKEPKSVAAPKPAEKKPVPAAKEPPAATAKKPVPAPGPVKQQVETAHPGTAAKAAKTATGAAKAPKAAPVGAAAVPAKKSPLKVASKNGAKAAVGAAAGPWTVVAGNYVLEEAMARDLARVKGAGLETAVKQGGRKKATMNRLLAGTYPTHAEAQSELEDLSRTTSDAFVLKHGETYAVYAGSYLLKDRANSEKERLAAAGIKLSLKHADVYLPSKNLTAGTFSDKKAAEAVRRKLKAMGITASLSHP